MASPSRMGSVAFVGGGMMAEAMVKGFLSSGVRAREQVHVFDPSAARRKVMTEKYGVDCPEDVGACVRGKPVVVVAVKPQYVASAMADARAHLSADALVVSIAAGTSLSTLRDVCPEARGIARVMPNTPASSARARAPSASAPAARGRTRRSCARSWAPSARLSR